MNVKQDKTRILLIAVCKPGTIGGQATAARLLIRYLGNEFDWSVISLPAPGQPGLLRFFISWKILFESLWIRVTKRVRIVHLFTSCTRLAIFEKLIIGFLLRLTGARTIINFRGAFDDYYINSSASEKKLARFLLKRQSVVLCQHNGTKDFLLLHGIVDENKINVIPNAVEEVDQPFKENSIGKQKKILCLTWIISHKGLDLLIDAAAQMKKLLTENNTVIEICGPEEEVGLKSKLQRRIEMAEATDVIHFLLPVSGAAKQQLMQGADIFVLPTRKEGFPNALLEAMMMGLPVVTTNKIPMNTIVQNDVTGLLFEEDNAVDLASQLTKLVQNDTLRNEIGDAGRNFVLGNYTPGKVMSAFSELYRKLR